MMFLQIALGESVTRSSIQHLSASMDIKNSRSASDTKDRFCYSHSLFSVFQRKEQT
jgi:hypothetical protein